MLSTRKNAREADFANSARLAASFRQSCLQSRIFCSYFPTPFLSLFRRYRWRASAHRWRIVLSSFFFLVSPLCRRARSLLKFSFRPLPEQSFRRVSPLEDRSISLRALSTGVLQYWACVSFLVRVWQPVNGLTLPRTVGLSSCGLNELKARLVPKNSQNSFNRAKRVSMQHRQFPSYISDASSDCASTAWIN